MGLPTTRVRARARRLTPIDRYPRDSNPGPLDLKSSILPLSYRPPGSRVARLEPEPSAHFTGSRRPSRSRHRSRGWRESLSHALRHEGGSFRGALSQTHTQTAAGDTVHGRVPSHRQTSQSVPLSHRHTHTHTFVNMPENILDKETNSKTYSH